MKPCIFKVFSSATQIFTLLPLIVFWNTAKSIRIFLGIALLYDISGNIFAFTYFHPRSDIIYLAEPIPDTETLKRLSTEWSNMNWVWSVVLLVGLFFVFSN